MTEPSIYSQLVEALRANLVPVAGGIEVEPAGMKDEFDQQAALSEEWIHEWRIRNRGLEEYYGLRRVWSAGLLALLSLLVVFQCGLLVAVGLGWLRFAEYQDFLKIQAGVYFAQVVSMCVVVVRFLFRDPTVAPLLASLPEPPIESSDPDQEPPSPIPPASE